MPARVRRVAASVAPLQQAVVDHRLYAQMQTVSDVAVFLEHHVFAVWDFMSLLKSLQADLTRVSPPWYPVGDGRIRRFINELVLEEESDHVGGRYISHLELYIEGMKQAGANPEPVTRLMRDATSIVDTEGGFASFGEAGRFIEQTWRFIHGGSLAERAGAFTFGREAMIPAMFPQIVARLDAHQPGRLALFRTYLERHIELDGDSHGPMAFHLLDTVCGDDDRAWAAAQAAAERALQARLALWDAIADRIDRSRDSSAIDVVRSGPKAHAAPTWRT